jgi:predicted amidohydrolase YtcJ
MTVDEVQETALRNGITTVGNLYTTDDLLEDMRSLQESGRLALRSNLYLIATDCFGRPQGDWYKDHPPTRRPGEMLRIGGIKIFTDGGACDRPALSYELSAGDGLGDLFFSQNELNALVAEVQGAGYQAAIHAIGDRGIEQALNAIEYSLAGENNSYRHRIEHNSIIRPDFIERYGDIGAIPVIFGLYPVCNPFGPPPPAEYRSWEWPYRDLVDANPDLPIAWHGDEPFFGRIRPLDDLYSLITRNGVDTAGNVCQGDAWLKEQTLTVEEVLPMMTINSAYALFRDKEVGSLEVGKFADLIVLSKNPLSVTPDELITTDVWLTMAGGRNAFCIEDQGWLCSQLDY